MNFGEKVKQLRAERNLTQPQLAQAIGIEQSYLSKLENDKSIPSADIFQAILKAFGVDVGTFLEGVDEKQLYRDLRQVPEVANHLNTVTTTRIHSIKTWLFASGIALALGLTIGFAAWRGLLFANKQFVYSSPGVIPPGEPTNYFEKFEDLQMQRFVAQEITDKERVALLLEFNKRIRQDFQLLDVYRGRGYIENVPGGTRAYAYVIHSQTERPQNRLLMLLGELLTFCGVVGFIVEARLRRVRI